MSENNSKINIISTCGECGHAIENTNGCGEPLGEYTCWFDDVNPRYVGDGQKIDSGCELDDYNKKASARNAIETPDWWPVNPYPVDIFPMTQEEFEAAVPDELTRARVSGRMARFGWNVASDAILRAMRERSKR